jgi:hypothetical protein
MRILGPKRDGVIGGWREVYNEELCNLYSLPSIIRMIKRMGWAGHVACMGAKWNAYRNFVGKPEGKRLLERPLDIAGRIIVKRILERQDGMA